MLLVPEKKSKSVFEGFLWWELKTWLLFFMGGVQADLLCDNDKR